MSVSRLGYITLGNPNPTDWRAFGTDILGTMSHVNEAGDVCLKVDDHPHRVRVVQHETAELLASGWEVEDPEVYDNLMSKLIEFGTEVQQGNEADARRRCVTKFFSGVDPAGNAFEVYYKRTEMGAPFQSAVDVSGFVTGDMGMGHVVIPAPNLDETRSFYETLLGLRLSDDLTMPGGPEGAPDIHIYFFHADNPRHHSLALFNQPVPSKIVHFMLEVSNVDEVGKCLDRVNDAGIPLMASLGRHCNDNMLSFYVFGPGQIPVEYGYDGFQLDPDTYQSTVSTKGDHWGHAYSMP